VAKSKAKWVEIWKSMVPNWYFEDSIHQQAHVNGFAQMMTTLEKDMEDHVDETFITRAMLIFLDAHGAERSIPRLVGEFDSQYSIRVQNLGNQSNCPDLKKIIDLLLIAGETTISEDFGLGCFADRDCFVNRGELLIDPIYNVFNVIVDKQIHAPYSFADREFFADRDDFVGMAESSDFVFQLILEQVNNNKALGTMYRIIERFE